MKVLLVMEYDLEGDEPAQAQIMSNLAIVDEAGVRPKQMHILIDDAALKVLSTVMRQAEA